MGSRGVDGGWGLAAGGPGPREGAAHRAGGPNFGAPMAKLRSVPRALVLGFRFQVQVVQVVQVVLAWWNGLCKACWVPGVRAGVFDVLCCPVRTHHVGVSFFKGTLVGW